MPLGAIFQPVSLTSSPSVPSRNGRRMPRAIPSLGQPLEFWTVDFLVLLIGAGFFALTVAYAVACDRL